MRDHTNNLGTRARHGGDRVIRGLSELEEIDVRIGAPRSLTVDLRETDEADSALVARLVLLTRRCRAAGILLLILPSEAVWAWLLLCRLECMLPVVEDTT